MHNYTVTVIMQLEYIWGHIYMHSFGPGYHRDSVILFAFTKWNLLIISYSSHANDGCLVNNVHTEIFSIATVLFFSGIAFPIYVGVTYAKEYVRKYYAMCFSGYNISVFIASVPVIHIKFEYLWYIKKNGANFCIKSVSFIYTANDITLKYEDAIKCWRDLTNAWTVLCWKFLALS